MPNDQSPRDVIDREAARVVEAYRDHGVSVDYGQTRERLRLNLVREEKTSHAGRRNGGSNG